MKLTHVFMVLCLSILLMGCQPKITMANASNDYINRNYLEVEKELKELGFENIVYKELEDLSNKYMEQKDKIKRIMINHQDTFIPGDSFSSDDEILLEVHSMKKCSLPLPLKALKTLDQDNVINHFKEVGFTKIKVKEVFDLDSELSNDVFQNELLLHGKVVENGDVLYPCDSEFELVVHRPIPTYLVDLHIQFPSNLFFNKYDVDMMVNEDRFDLLHGESEDYSLRVKPGTYELIFKKVDDYSVQGKYQLVVDKNLDIELEVKCKSNGIDVVECYRNTLIETKSDEVRIDFNIDDFSAKHYEDVVNEFIARGFSNIQVQPVYDIVWGFTQEGSVKEILFNGSSQFKKGHIVKKDSEIIIKYHMRKYGDKKWSKQATVTVGNA